MAKKLLIIGHTPSPNTEAMFEAVIRGASHPDCQNIDVQALNVKNVEPADICSAAALILGTTENLGYMAGLTKDLFDRCYYPCIEHTEGLPVAFYIRAGHDGTGTLRALKTISTGLRWKMIQQPLICRGEFQQDFLTQCHELGLTMAASLDYGII